MVRPHCYKNSQFGLSWKESGSFWFYRCIRINHVCFGHIYHISKCHSFIVDLCGQKSLPLGSERAAVSFVVTELEQLGSSDSCPYLVKSPDPLYGTYRCNAAPLHNLPRRMRKPAWPKDLKYSVFHFVSLHYLAFVISSNTRILTVWSSQG